MSELNEIYQELIIDHNRRPRNFGKMNNYTNYSKGYNPLCGDEVEFYLEITNNKINKIQFTGVGCAISKGSSSLFTETLKSKKINDAQHITNIFKKMVTNQLDSNEKIEDLGDLTFLSGISAYPARIKCAILACHTIESAIRNDQSTITTE